MSHKVRGVRLAGSTFTCKMKRINLTTEKPSSYDMHTPWMYTPKKKKKKKKKKTVLIMKSFNFKFGYCMGNTNF